MRYVRDLLDIEKALCRQKPTTSFYNTLSRYIILPFAASSPLNLWFTIFLPVLPLLLFSLIRLIGNNKSILHIPLRKKHPPLKPLTLFITLIILTRIYVLYLLPHYLLKSLSFDFSDHIVLYFVQVYPISIITLNSLTGKIDWKSVYSFSRKCSKKARCGLFFKGAIIVYVYILLPILLIINSLMGSYKTARYFHTPFETIVGGFICYGFWFGVIYFGERLKEL